ncbi:MAG TPA: winged helix-turn-helix domain-containing protein [Actinomycetes bacterium]|nr:winged helix-turn-helix domain-containing protein [Actinomycetes bacterium]
MPLPSRRRHDVSLPAHPRGPQELSHHPDRRTGVTPAQGGVAALRRRRAGGRPPKLSDAQAAQVEQALRQGAKANGFATDLWTLDRVAQVVQRVTGVRLARASTWRLLVGRLGWSLQRPERQARERDEEAIARWVAYEWPRIKKGRARNRPG